MRVCYSCVCCICANLHMARVFRHWAVAVPAYLIVCALLLLCVYVGLTMIRLPKFSSFNAIVGMLKLLRTSHDYCLT